MLPCVSFSLQYRLYKYGKRKQFRCGKHYSALVYNFIVNNEDIHFTINSQLLLETLLMEICRKTISYSSYKKRENEKQGGKKEMTQLKWKLI